MFMLKNIYLDWHRLNFRFSMEWNRQWRNWFEKPEKTKPAQQRPLHVSPPTHLRLTVHNGGANYPYLRTFMPTPYLAAPDCFALANNSVFSLPSQSPFSDRTTLSSLSLFTLLSLSFIYVYISLFLVILAFTLFFLILPIDWTKHFRFYFLILLQLFHHACQIWKCKYEDRE